MRSKLKLSNGATGFTNDAGKWVCTGSQMGRRDVLPDNRQTPCKLRLTRLPMVDYNYDKWGAYWGSNPGTAIYCAWGDCEDITAYVFVRAVSRDRAKAEVCKSLPKATFYR